jgi:hypothetical protein
MLTYDAIVAPHKATTLLLLGYPLVTVHPSLHISKFTISSICLIVCISFFTIRDFLIMKLIAPPVCPLGCGCGFSWWDVAFNCQGACVVEMRVTWLACLREALAGLSDGVPHAEWRQLVALAAGAARANDLVFRDGSRLELAMRRLVGGCVIPTISTKGLRRGETWRRCGSYRRRMRRA